MTNYNYMSYNVFDWIKTKILKSESLSIRDNSDSEYMKLYKKDDYTSYIYNPMPYLRIGNYTYNITMTSGGVFRMKIHLWPYGDDLYQIGTSINRFKSGYFGTGGLYLNSKMTVDGTTTIFNLPAVNNPPISPAEGDIYLDDGSNTADGNPHFRLYRGGLWYDL